MEKQKCFYFSHAEAFGSFPLALLLLAVSKMERQKQTARKANGKKAQATCEESLASSQRCESVLKHPQEKGGKRKGKTGVSTIARLPFGIMRHNLQDLSPNNALFFYEVCVFLLPYHFYHIYTHTHLHTHSLFALTSSGSISALWFLAARPAALAAIG
jgi:hypothetical protein